MLAPLVDIDANPRQPGFKPTKAGSKIPNPPRSQRSGSADRRSPFSVSTTGSPCYTATSTTPNNIMLHASTSKLPRKSTPTQSACSKSYTYGSKPVKPHSSLPRDRGELRSPATTVPLNTVKRKTSPLLSCNKPLPSPPFAQIVNSASPAKPQRTLVDAEAGTPTDEQWPILRPENVLPSKHPNSSTVDDLVHCGVSKGSAGQRNNISAPRSQVTTPLSRILSQQSRSSTGKEASSDEKSRRTAGSQPFSSMNPYSQPFHALSTDNEAAIDSPLVRKQQNAPLVIVPPRVSSKRDSLPSSGALTDNLISQSTCASLRPIEPSSTEWPVLADVATVSPNEHRNDGNLSSFQNHPVAEPEPSRAASFASADKIRSRFGSIDSISTWSLGAGSSLDNKSKICREGSFRIKRLSGHSHNSESGPVLRIFAGADAVILGREDSIPAVPILSEQISEYSSQERPISTLAGRISRQMLGKPTPTPESCTSTSSATHTGSIKSETVKTSPIRSMQPPRKPSTGVNCLESDCDSGSMSASLEDPMERDFVPPDVKTCSSFESPGDVPVSHLYLEDMPRVLVMERGDGHSSVKEPIAFQDEVHQKSKQVLGTNDEIPHPASRERMSTTETTSGSASSKTTTMRSKTSPFLPSSDLLKIQVARYSDRSPNLVPSRLARSIPSQSDVRQSGPSRSEAKHMLTQRLEAGPCRSTSTATETIRKSTVDTAVKMRAKRSFRNIFHRRDLKTTPQPDKKQVPKRSSVTGSALAQRIRDSTNFSKVSLAKTSEAVVETEPSVILSPNSIKRPGVVQQKTSLTPEPTAAMLRPQPESVARYETANVVHKILDRVMTMTDDPPDRLRGLEIAEAILHTVECFQEAGLSAELARKHARDAELNADRAGLELKRLVQLCEPGFDDETMQSVKQLITAAGVGRLPEIRVE